MATSSERRWSILLFLIFCFFNDVNIYPYHDEVPLLRNYFFRRSKTFFVLFLLAFQLFVFFAPFRLVIGFAGDLSDALFLFSRVIFVKISFFSILIFLVFQTSVLPIISIYAIITITGVYFFAKSAFLCK